MLKDFTRERVDKADDASRLLKYVEEIRIAEKNLIIRHEEEYAEELKKILNSVYKQIETTKAKMKRKININQMTRMRNAVEAYEKNFAKNYDFNSIKKKKEESMIASAREFMNITEKGRSIAKKKLESNTNSTRTTLIIFLVIILGISFSIGFLINRTISGGIQKILIQFNQLIKNVLEGKLDSRGDSESVGVDFKGIIDQTNELIDAFMGPLNVTAEYVDRISKGDLPEKITDDYKGDFNEIKNNLNQCIDAINELVADANILSNAAVQGKLDTRADAGKHQGDYAAIVKGVNDTLDAVIGPLNVAAEYVDRISKGDLPEKITDNYNGDFNEIKNNLNMMIENLTNFAINAQTASGQVASGSEQMSSGAQEMAQSASEQSASVEQVSSSMEEMNSSVIQNADNAKETASISEKAAVDAEDGGKSVAETVQAMKSIAEKISVIEGIATQTNMLALNAAIEAARAGEHGKGFAVVASEVRDLAERSAIAAKEISDLSSTSVEIAEKAGKLIENIVPQIKKTAELVQEINASSSEQANGIQQVTEAVEQLDKAIQQNASATEEMASTSEELSTQAVQLQKVAGFFKVDNTVASSGQLKHIQSHTKSSQRLQQSSLQNNKNYNADAHSKIDMGSIESAKAEAVIDMSTVDDSEFERY